MPIDPLHRLADPSIPLTPDDFRAVAEEILDGRATASRVGAALASIRARGENGDALAAFSQALSDRAVAFPRPGELALCVDTCGTGGDASGTFNVSTTAALIVAAAGVGVAKHGNRAASSHCGSADVLHALGLSTDLSPTQSARQLERHKFCFLFAPAYHPALKPLGPLRKELGFRTIFNFVGPLVNPANPPVQLVGVCEERMLLPMAEALRARGRHRALVVHASDGLDEITLTGPTTGIHLEHGALEPWSLELEALGIEPVESAALLGASIGENAAIIEEILRGGGGPCAEIACLNAGAVLWLAGKAVDVAAGLAIARVVQRSGAPWRLLRDLIDSQHA